MSLHMDIVSSIVSPDTQSGDTKPMPALIIAIITAAGLALLFGLLIADMIEGARYQREVEARDAARHARADRA